MRASRRMLHSVVACIWIVVFAVSAALAATPVELTVMTWMYQPNTPAWVEIVEAYREIKPHVELN